MNKIILRIKTIHWIVYLFAILQGEIVITEIFISPVEETDAIPRFIELYNNGETAVDLTNWTILTYNIDGELIGQNIPFIENPTASGVCESGFCVGGSNNGGECVVNEMCPGFPPFMQLNNSIIESKGYLLIGSSFDTSCSDPTGCIFYNNLGADIWAPFFLIPEITIKLIRGDGITVEDNVTVTSDWPYFPGRSMRYHGNPNTHLNTSDNDASSYWSQSPVTDISERMFIDISDVRNFGSPRKENSFQISTLESNIGFDISVFPQIWTITGDAKKFYTADNNYQSSLDFNWIGTLDNTSGYQYRIIINKLSFWKPIAYGLNPGISDYTSNIVYTNNNSQTPFYYWDGNLVIDSILTTNNTSTTINSADLFDQLEEATYTWTVQLTKDTDIIYSDIDTFKIDARDYGVYGCIDDGTCTVSSGFPTCATTLNEAPLENIPVTIPEYQYNYTLISKHPIGCTPGGLIAEGGCYYALNFHETANINSNTCEYVSLSIPEFITGEIHETISVPVYLDNEDSLYIEEIHYTLSFDSNIASNLNGNINGTVLSDLIDMMDIDYTNQTVNSISVEMIFPSHEANTFFTKEGVITNIDFDLIGIAGAFSDINFSDVKIIGGNHNNYLFEENQIEVPTKDGDIVILQDNYEISGNVFYYFADGPPYMVPNVTSTLKKNNYVYTNLDSSSSHSSYSRTSGIHGRYEYQELTEGNYRLSFSKDDSIYCSGNISQYVSGVDASKIAKHVTGYELLDDTKKLIAADVSLDGTVSGHDASMVAQYSVGLIDNVNHYFTHWIFKPQDYSTLESLNAELILQNGQYRIDYKPLIIDDKSRHIYAYRLGDVSGNYCRDSNQSRSKKSNIHFQDLYYNYQTVLTVSVIIPEPISIEGLNIEIGYEDEFITPLSFNFDPENLFSDNYESLSNLFSNEGLIKTVIWAKNESQLISGLVGEVSFIWENENFGGKIWLGDVFINDAYARNELKLTDIDGAYTSDGLNIINLLQPIVLSLKQNYPNPFNPTTSIYWSMPNSEKVSIEIYNLQGRFIDTLFSDYKESGNHEIVWNAAGYSSGIYFYRLKVGKTMLQKKMILLQ